VTLQTLLVAEPDESGGNDIVTLRKAFRGY
jgi:hypothetical protein